MSRVRLTPQEIADKQIKRSTAATQDYKDGVMAVTKSPTQAAAERIDAWFQGIQDAYNDGRFKEGLLSVSLEDWKTRTASKGAASYASGVAASKDKIVEFQTQRQQAQASIDSTLASMPRGDLAQNLQRMVTQATMMHNFKFKKRRRG